MSTTLFTDAEIAADVRALRQADTLEAKDLAEKIAKGIRSKLPENIHKGKGTIEIKNTAVDDWPIWKRLIVADELRSLLPSSYGLTFPPQPKCPGPHDWAVVTIPRDVMSLQ